MVASSVFTSFTLTIRYTFAKTSQQEEIILVLVANFLLHGNGSADTQGIQGTAYGAVEWL